MIIRGDALQIPLRDKSVQCVVTSLPYWGLRDYKLPPLVWGGDQICEHEWSTSMMKTEVGKGNWAQGKNGRGELQPGGVDEKRKPMASAVTTGSCVHCSAWLGCLGLEPTPELYVRHVVEIFREVWRVLRDDGTLWLNLGDSYNGGNKGNSGPLRPGDKQATNKGSWSTRRRDSGTLSPTRQGGCADLKVKDLIGIPWRVAFALQADGWYLRSDIIWAKPNPMPESVTDRPTKAHEYIFLLAKSGRYYFDQDAVREPVSPNTHLRLSQYLANQIGSFRANGGAKTNGPMKAVGKKAALGEIGVVKSNPSFEAAVCLPVYSRNIRTVWTIATQPFSEAHFATFPEDLIKPCILAGCPVGGVVFDPFVGSGTTVKVAQDLGRIGVGMDLNAEYLTFAGRRSAQWGLRL